MDRTAAEFSRDLSRGEAACQQRHYTVREFEQDLYLTERVTVIVRKAPSAVVKTLYSLVNKRSLRRKRDGLIRSDLLATRLRQILGDFDFVLPYKQCERIYDR